eukprot:scaffold320171_cov15-Tisochrysis_lutea.AAC.1
MAHSLFHHPSHISPPKAAMLCLHLGTPMPDPYKRYAPEVHAQRPNLASPFSCAAWRAEVRSLLSARAVREASTKLLARWRAAASARLDAVS